MRGNTRRMSLERADEADDAVVWSDERLLQQFLRGPGESAEAAFSALVERHAPLVHRVCWDVLQGADDHRDAAQAVFLVLARKAGSIRKPGSLGPWLHGVALRVARRARSMAIRRRLAERAKAEITQRREADREGPGAMDHAELHEEIDRLPAKYRHPLILCYLRGQTQAEAAEGLGWPLGTVQVRLHRGRAELRRRLARRGVGVAGASFAALLAPSSARAAAPGSAWVEATVRAAVRSAAGRSAGLVAPGVSSLAGWAIRSMLVSSAGAIGLIATGLLAGAVGLAMAWGSRPGPSRPGPAAVAPAQVAEVAPAEPVRAVVPASAPGLASQPLPPDVAVAAVDRGAPPREAIPPEAAPARPALAEPPAAPVAVLAARRPIPSPASGRELFERTWTKNDPRGHGGDGLGPVFNGRSCVDCHHQGGTGGAGGLDRNIEIATATDAFAAGGYGYSFRMDFGAGTMQYQFGFPQGGSQVQSRLDPRLLTAIHPGFEASRSVVLHHYGTDPTYHTWREALAGQHGTVAVRTTERNTPPLFGAGLIDSIPESAIEAAARRKFAGSTQVRGRVSRLADGRIGRFGWKAQTATLEEFVSSAAAGEMGLEVPGRHQASDPRVPGLGSPGLDMDESDCRALVAYVRGLPRPVSAPPVDEAESAQVEAGAATFRAIGCAGCHVPKLGDVDGIYSDLLLHDMGPQPAADDGYSVFAGASPRADASSPERPAAASAREWRTPPLWGLRDSAPYLHDGRAPTIDRAIALHAGQAAGSARRFAELSPRRRRQIESFLHSLAAPRP